MFYKQFEASYVMLARVGCAPTPLFTVDTDSVTESRLIASLEVCHPRCVCENWKGYVVKHYYVNSFHSFISIQP